MPLYLYVASFPKFIDDRLLRLGIEVFLFQESSHSTCPLLTLTAFPFSGDPATWLGYFAVFPSLRRCNVCR